MPTLSDTPTWFVRLFALLFGLVWGSFINVVVYRVPRGQSVVHPGSHCPACGTPIRAWDNVPVLSYLLLKGRARCCSASISPRYAVIEAIGGLLALALVEAVILQLPPETSLTHAAMVFLADLALVLGLVAASFIDLEHMYIPDSISYGATILGVATVPLRPPLGFVNSISAAIGAYLAVWLLFGALYRLIRKRTGMGLGDAKLLMVAGAWFGWEGAVFALLAGAVQGLVAAVVVLVVSRGRIPEPEAVQRERESILADVAAIEDEKERAQAEKEALEDPIFEQSAKGVGQSRIAFGPFLTLASMEYLFLGQTLVDSYLRFMDRILNYVAPYAERLLEWVGVW